MISGLNFIINDESLKGWSQSLLSESASYGLLANVPGMGECPSGLKDTYFSNVTFQPLTETHLLLWSVIIIYKRFVLNRDLTSK